MSTSVQTALQWIAKFAAAAAAAIAVAWALPQGYDENGVSGGTATLNQVIIERFLHEYPRKRVVLAGSSILTNMPPWYCRPDDVATLYLQGRSATTGLEALLRVQAHPEAVFVEVPTAAIGVDDDLIHDVFTPIYWRAQALIPPLGKNRNWFVLSHRWLTDGKATETRLELPVQSKQEWDEMFKDRWQPLLREYRNDASIRAGVDQVVPRINALRQRGIRVVLYDPIDPRLYSRSPAKDLRAAIREAFPDLEWVDAPDDLMAVYRWDWLHFHPASGLQFFNYLMERTGLRVTPKCEVVSHVAS